MADTQRKIPNECSIISCRLCDRVFSSTQALINHVSDHYCLSQSAAANSNWPLQPTLCSSPPSLVRDQNEGYLKRKWLAMQYPTPSLSPLLPPLPMQDFSGRPNYGQIRPPAAPSALRNQTMLMADQEALRRYFTKPYINQLERRIPEVMGVDESDDDKASSGKLDLTLKL